jgi:hypothetical protein
LFGRKMTDDNQNDEANLADKSVDNNSTMKFYKDSKDYWSKIEPTVNGMLGGYEHVSAIDIATSQDFLNVLIKVGVSGNISVSKTLMGLIICIVFYLRTMALATRWLLMAAQESVG